MSRFKIGQRVVFIPNGSEFVVDGFTCCKGCGEPRLYLVGVHKIGNIECDTLHGIVGCGYILLGGRKQIAEVLFAPLEEIESAIENLMEQSNLITK